MKKLRLFKPDPVVEFRCYEEDWDVIPKPYPARKFMPDWYKSLEPHLPDEDGTQSKKFQSSTIKRCAPFLDALCVGWIMPLAADVYLEADGECKIFKWDWGEYNKPMIEEHTPAQLNNEKHPEFPKWPLKWMNYWSIKLPPGWSMLFVPPLGRPNPHFTCLPGIVDDGYIEFINFPFLFNTPNFKGRFEQGTPLVQMIPIRRDSFDIKSYTEQFDAAYHNELALTRRKRAACESHYRNKIWNRK